jgi:glyoxylase-like metal-dependent hydrolase (beta-lactamase superfamily II)
MPLHQPPPKLHNLPRPRKRPLRTSLPTLTPSTTNDAQGEFPHIYVKLITQTTLRGETIQVLLLNDTGVGSQTPCTTPDGVPTWNISTYIAHNVNPGGYIPYLVVLTHCHYDHILGLTHLLQNGSHVSVLSSSRDKAFVTPYEVLAENSLCNDMHLPTPKYETRWAGDFEDIVYAHPEGTEMRLPIITIHTPGHTPDSLSWYDVEERVLYVGDSFYAQSSTDTNDAPWGPESPAAILFPREGDLTTWWRSLAKLSSFVDERNGDGGKRVALCASHVTVNVDAAVFLADVKGFMGEILRGEAEFEEAPEKRGEKFGYWTIPHSAFKLGAPVRIVHEGREGIPREEYTNEDRR